MMIMMIGQNHFYTASGSLQKFNQFFLFNRFIFGKNFRKDPISSFYVKLLTDRQTDRQADRQKDSKTYCEDITA